ncbi:hypothetical protein PINS_up003084 [Pythium insidiosum]|nr:hypothetical protein PINS_up003084 [Pythium insidiosum]
MLPLYRRTVRFLSDPYVRMKKKAVLSTLGVLVLLYLVLLASESFHRPEELIADDGPSFQRPQQQRDDELERERARLALRREELGGHYEDDARRPVPGAETGAEDGVTDAPAQGEATPSQAPYIIRLLLPLLAGFCFGFLGSVPIAGPTSAMVLKLGIQGKYQAGLTIAFGGAISEATYAGIAFWGFGSFLAGAKFLLPASKVLGAIMFTVVGTIFLRSDVQPPLNVDADTARHRDMRTRPRDEIIKNVLLGVTMSGINPALLATYTGAIASVYGTGMLEFTLFLALVFGIGVWCGVSTWFFLLLSLLKKYKQRLKNQTIAYIMRGMGCFLLTLGVFCAKSAFDYFFWGPQEPTS